MAGSKAAAITEITNPTPREALELLLAGNRRFVAGTVEHPNQDAARRSQVAPAQHPFAVLFGCSDSRLAAEIIFDRGLGDLWCTMAASSESSDPSARVATPPIRNRPAVELLRFEPRIIETPQQKHHPGKATRPQTPQVVSGFVRRLPPGHTARYNAREAHTKTQRHTEVANDGPLQPQYTFVRRHQRGKRA